MRPFQRLAVDILFQQPFLHHQPKVGPGAPPGRIGGFVDDVAQVVQPSGLLRAALSFKILMQLHSASTTTHASCHQTKKCLRFAK
jgi:hypothetical protein